jgi:uncharacterized membrane protein YebE (DUF533 family)
MTSKLTAAEALIYAMITAAAVDRKISETELARIGSMIRELPAFGETDGDWLAREAQDCGRILAKPNGIDRVLMLIREGLPAPMFETAYALAAEVASSDLVVMDEEVRFLEKLADTLGLDDLICAALERGARARHRTTGHGAAT